MTTPIYWIEGPWPGRLAIVPRPRGGDWLQDEIQAWKAAGLAVVVSALTADESADFDLQPEQAFCEELAIRFISFPITDRGVPMSLKATKRLVKELEAKLSEGEKVAVHCRQGIGRSSLIAASVLVAGGTDPETAFARIRASRGCPVPETAEQKEWVLKLGRDLTVRTGA